MDAPCKIQGSIHVFRLVNNMCPGKWVHISWIAPLCYTALYFLGDSPFSAASLSVRHLRSKYL